MKCYRCNSWPCTCADGQTILHGDARELLPALTADVVVSDPPYGIDKGRGTIGKRGRASRVTWPDTVEDVRTRYVPIIVASLELTGGRGIITPGSPNAFEYPKPKDIGAILQPCATGCSSWGRATIQPVLFYGKDPYAGKHLQPITFTQTKAAEKVGFPCNKPLAVARWMVARATRIGELVLDPFLGSGTTAVACMDQGRRCIGIEIEERYCEIAANRLRQEVLNFTD